MFIESVNFEEQKVYGSPAFEIEVPTLRYIAMTSGTYMGLAKNLKVADQLAPTATELEFLGRALAVKLTEAGETSSDEYFAAISRIEGPSRQGRKVFFYDYASSPVGFLAWGCNVLDSMMDREEAAKQA